MSDNSISRQLSSILRHQAIQLGLSMRSDGCVSVDDLLSLSSMKHVTLVQLKRIVDTNNKQRFSFDTTGKFIRANQGHSHQIAKCLKAEEFTEVITQPLSVCVHGTYRTVIDYIIRDGLKVMNRDHIHLAAGLFGDVISGMRSNVDVLIYIDMDKAMKDGIEFRKSSNGVILTHGMNGTLSSEYFKNIIYK